MDVGDGSNWFKVGDGIMGGTVVTAEGLGTRQFADGEASQPPTGGIVGFSLFVVVNCVDEVLVSKI